MSIQSNISDALLKEVRSRMSEIAKKKGILKENETLKTTDFQQKLMDALGDALFTTLSFAQGSDSVGTPYIAAPLPTPSPPQPTSFDFNNIVAAQVSLASMQASLASSGGEALRDFLEAIMSGIKLALASNYTLTKGANAVVGTDQSTVSGNIRKALPGDILVKMSQSPGGLALIDSLSAGISNGLTLGFVPVP